MVGIKNKSQAPVSYSFDGTSYVFNPGEIKALPAHIVDHLVRASATCAVGGSPLFVIADKDIPAELASAGAAEASPSLSCLVNLGDQDISLMEDGQSYVVPAHCEVILPLSLAEALLARHVGSGRTGISIKSYSKPSPSLLLPQSGNDAKMESKKSSRRK